MRFLIGPLLDEAECQGIREKLEQAGDAWLAGAETAGWHARKVKTNQQLDQRSELHQALAAEIQNRLGSNSFFRAAAFPRRIHSILFNCCNVGQGYGRHVDNAWMAGGRTDLSFTLFLTPPQDYEGGALVLESPNDEESFRPPAGYAIVYPSTSLHRVEPVTKGQRLAVVGWVESRIRHAEQRELLFDLDTAKRALFERSGKDEVFDLISRSYSNLLRRWDS